MSGYGQFARVLAGIWLLVQMIILLDFIYDVNEWLLKKVRLCQRGISLLQREQAQQPSVQMSDVCNIATVQSGQ